MTGTVDSAVQFDERIQVLDSTYNVSSVIRKIIEECGQEDGFYVCDLSDLLWKHNNWKKLLPRVETYYAVKCNDSRLVLETLTALETGFDCASKEEIRRILSLGVHPDKIIYANPAKKVNHILYAAEVGVSMMTFDNEIELYKIKTHFPNAKLVLRIKCDDLTAKFVLGEKFGVNPDEEAKKLLTLAKSLDLNVIGVSFHVGSGGTFYSIFSKAIEAARRVFDMGISLGYNFDLLDIGGGFPGEKASEMHEIAKIINEALRIHFPDKSIRIISEPGTYYVQSAFFLASNVHSKKIITMAGTNHKEKELRMYYVDVGIYGGLIPTLFQEYYKCRPLNAIEDPQLFPSIIWGTTCDITDKISEDSLLLPDIDAGEWIIFENTGAYTLAVSSDFNGFPAPKVHAIINTEDWLLLTEKVPCPIPKEKFVIGKSPKHFLTGLAVPDRFRSNYF